MRMKTYNASTACAQRVPTDNQRIIFIRTWFRVESPENLSSVLSDEQKVMKSDIKVLTDVYTSSKAKAATHFLMSLYIHLHLIRNPGLHMNVFGTMRKPFTFITTLIDNESMKHVPL